MLCIQSTRGFSDFKGFYDDSPNKSDSRAATTRSQLVFIEIYAHVNKNRREMSTHNFIIL